MFIPRWEHPPYNKYGKYARGIYNYLKEFNNNKEYEGDPFHNCETILELDSTGLLPINSLELAVDGRNLECIKLVHNLGHKSPIEVIDNACVYGDYENIVWLYKNGYKCTTKYEANLKCYLKTNEENKYEIHDKIIEFISTYPDIHLFRDVSD